MKMTTPSLAGKVCIVTGATRGIGKGIALQLADAGSKVYITGRTLEPVKNSKIGGSLLETAEEIRKRGGHCIPVLCDHSNDIDVKSLFEQVEMENDGRLDVLVNNAYSAVDTVIDTIKTDFWELPVDYWDTVNRVGLRNHYICSVYAARLMAPRQHGLILNISSSGGLMYMMNPVYGIGKEACDRMAADCGHELEKHNVAFVSLWPGAIRTEHMVEIFENGDAEKLASMPMEQIDSVRRTLKKTATPEFVGQCIAAMANDPNVMKMNGKIVLLGDLALRYNLKNKEEGHEPSDFTRVNFLLEYGGFDRLAQFVPNLVRIPKWIVHLGSYKFF
ncbi:Dehydrogenase reductase SDR member [Mactra antiquata]